MSLGNHFRWYEVINATPGRYPRHPWGLTSGWLASSAMTVSQPSRRALRRHDGRRKRGQVDGEAESSVRSLMWGVRHPECCRGRRAPDPPQRRSRPGRKARHHPHQQPHGARSARIRSGLGLHRQAFPLVITDEAGNPVTGTKAVRSVEGSAAGIRLYHWAYESSSGPREARGLGIKSLDVIGAQLPACSTQDAQGRYG